MKDHYLYQEIAEVIRMDIMEGRYRPGDRLPSIRDLITKWSCTPGTVQRAYLELARMGLVTSQVGKGTHVVCSPDQQAITGKMPLRMARLVHEAEAFILASITAGYSPQDIQNSISHAMDRWRSIQEIEIQSHDPKRLRFSGSHDLVVTWIARHINNIIPGITPELQFSGSLGGLMAVAEGRADLAGCHLLDPETRAYNEPYIRKLFPGKKMVMIVLAERKLGFMVLPGDPNKIHEVNDLAKPGIRFVNRQHGSGTRVWIDLALEKCGVSADDIQGYHNEKVTHSDVARAIAEGEGDVGIGLETAAVDFQLEFHPLTREIYHLVTTVQQAEEEPVASFMEWLRTRAKDSLPIIPGYNFDQTGKLSIVG